MCGKRFNARDKYDIGVFISHNSMFVPIIFDHFRFELRFSSFYMSIFGIDCTFIRKVIDYNRFMFLTQAF